MGSTYFCENTFNGRSDLISFLAEHLFEVQGYSLGGIDLFCENTFNGRSDLISFLAEHLFEVQG